MAEITIKNMEMDGIFPTPIGIMKGFKISEQERNFLLSQEMGPNMYNTKSNDMYLLRHKELADLKEKLWECLNIYFQNYYRPHPYVQIRITQCWLNRCLAGEHHHMHYHQNSILSGCLYLQTNKEKDKIVFYNTEKPPIDFSATEYNTFNSRVWSYNVEPGQLILFPSTTHHAVPEHVGEEPRISLAFNTFASGILGEKDAATELILNW